MVPGFEPTAFVNSLIYSLTDHACKYLDFG